MHAHRALRSLFYSARRQAGCRSRRCRLARRPRHSIQETSPDVFPRCIFRDCRGNAPFRVPGTRQFTVKTRPRYFPRRLERSGTGCKGGDGRFDRSRTGQYKSGFGNNHVLVMWISLGRGSVGREGGAEWKECGAYNTVWLTFLCVSGANTRHAIGSGVLLVLWQPRRPERFYPLRQVNC